MVGIGRTNAVGGTALNFKVVPGLTQPGTASENTIWVKAERIGVWYFSATQPDNMQEWDVWFPMSTASTVEFNALKKNAVQVYPLSAKQMVSGALVDVTAKSYQNGVWVEWIRSLYEPGNECVNITGGWQTRGWKYASDYATTVPTKENRDECMRISSSTFEVTSGVVEVKKDIDLTSVKTLKLDVGANINNMRVYLIAIKRTETYCSNYNAGSLIFESKASRTNFARTEKNLDVSGLNGVYDIAIAHVAPWTGGMDGYIDMYSLRME